MGVVERWSNGVMLKHKNFANSYFHPDTPVLQYSNTPNSKTLSLDHHLRSQSDMRS